MEAESAPALPAASGSSTAGASATSAGATSIGQMFAPNRSLEFADNRLTDEEMTALVALKADLEKNPLKPADAAKRFDDFDLAKFVVVAKGNLAKCRKRIQNFVNYHALHKLDELTLEEAVTFLLSELNVFEYVPTLDKEGRMTLYMDGGALLPSVFNTEKKFRLMLKFFFIFMDLLTSTISLTRKGCVFVTDMRTFGWKNFDRKLEEKCAGLYQDCYPIKFARMLMVNPPWYINAVMTIMKLFLKKKIADRMKCVWIEDASGDKLLSTHVGKHQVPEGLGGTLSDAFHPWMAAQMGFAYTPPPAKAKAAPAEECTASASKETS